MNKYSRKERGQIRHVLTLLTAAEQREFRSNSNPDKTYTAYRMNNGKLTCDCPGWTVKKKGKPRWCKHLDELLGSRLARSDGEFIYVVGTEEEKR